MQAKVFVLVLDLKMLLYLQPTDRELDQSPLIKPESSKSSLCHSDENREFSYSGERLKSMLNSAVDLHFTFAIPN